MMPLILFRYTVIYIIFLAIALAPHISVSQPITLPKKDTNEVMRAALSIMNEADMKNASFGFYAVDIMSGKVIAEIDPDMSLVPASVMKLVTTSVALEMLGQNYRFKTTLEYDGTLDSLTGVLNGNIFIKGGGDPTLGSMRFKTFYYKDLFWDKWVDTIKNCGIKSVKGSVIGDASIFDYEITPPTWVWGDIGNHYGASPCGLSIFDNIYNIYFRSGPSDGDSTWIDSIVPAIPSLKIENYVKASKVNKDLAYIYGSVYTDLKRARGTIPRNRKEYKVKGAIPDPAYTTAFYFDKYLRDKGVDISKNPTTIRRLQSDSLYEKTERKVIYNFYSPRLKYIIQQTNNHSVNLYAEHLLNQIGKQKFPNGGVKEGSKAVERFLESKGIDIAGLYINDGSGLSRYNAITARQVTDLLKYMKKNSKNFEVFYNSMAIAGKSGTMARLCKGTLAEYNLRAKSGYMTRARGYAGYVTTKGKKEVAFTMIVNNYNCSASTMKKKLERLMIKLAELD